MRSGRALLFYRAACVGGLAAMAGLYVFARRGEAKAWPFIAIVAIGLVLSVLQDIAPHFRGPGPRR